MPGVTLPFTRPAPFLRVQLRFLLTAFVLLLGPGPFTSASFAQATSATAVRSTAPATRPPEIIAYLFPNDRTLDPAGIPVQQLTRINYSFALIHDGRMVEGSPVDAANLASLQSLREHNPSLQLLVSVGGWLGSGGFSDAALTPASRRVFVDSAVAFLRRYKLDGLDIDWEYPGLPGANNRFRPDDGAHFTALLQELRARFDQETALTHRPLLLTIAAGAFSLYLSHTEMAQDAALLDDINLMAYDFYDSTDDVTGNHAALFLDPRDPRALAGASVVHAFEQAGVPASKLILGVPFYGHLWGNVPPENHGLFQHGTRVTGYRDAFPNGESDMLARGFTRFWDEAAAVPFLYNEATRQFYTYEDSESLRRKCAFIQQEHLGGLMFWQYFSSSRPTLLSVAYDALHSAHSDGDRP